VSNTLLSFSRCLIVREESRKSENLCTRFATCQPNNMFIILIRPWEESRPSSRISGFLSSRRMPIDCVYIGGYVNKPGVCYIVFGAEGRQSGTSVPRERLYLRIGAFKLYLYVTDD